MLVGTGAASDYMSTMPASQFTMLSRLMEELGSVAVATVPILIDGALAGA